MIRLIFFLLLFPALCVAQVDIEIFELGHDIVEGQEHDKIWDKMKESLNVKRKLIEGTRVRGMYSGSSNAEILMDSLVIFGLTHSTELIAGPAAVFIGLSNEWPAWVVSAIGAAGAAISVPFLVDPLCIIAFISYRKSAKFRGLVRTIRIGVVRGLQTFSDYIGFTRFMKSHFQKASMSQHLLGLPNLKDVVFSSRKEHALYTYRLNAGDKWVEFEVRQEAERASVTRTSINFEHLTENQKTMLLEQAKSMGLGHWMSDLISYRQKYSLQQLEFLMINKLIRANESRENLVKALEKTKWFSKLTSEAKSNPYFAVFFQEYGRSQGLLTDLAEVYIQNIEVDRKSFRVELEKNAVLIKAPIERVSRAACRELFI